jgi:hypothetical protein
MKRGLPTVTSPDTRKARTGRRHEVRAGGCAAEGGECGCCQQVDAGVVNKELMRTHREQIADGFDLTQETPATVDVSARAFCIFVVKIAPARL